MSHTPREQLAWAAGLFDGEGSTYIRHKQPRKDGSRYYYPALVVGQADPEVLVRFIAATGLGKVTGPFLPYGTSKRMHWKAQIYGHAQVQAAIAMLWDWLSTPKREQATRVLAEMRANNGW